MPNKIKFLLAFLLLIPTQLIAFELVEAPKFDPCNAVGYAPISQRYDKGIFFEISKCGIAPSHILGTMHSDLAQIKQSIPRSVFGVLSKASSANFELKDEPQVQVAMMTAMYYPQKSSDNLPAIIGPEIYGKLRQTLAENRPDLDPIIYDRMKPWAVALLMQVPPDQGDGVHLDALLEKVAIKQKVPVNGLETVGQQLSVFTDLSEAEQIQFLQESIDNFADSERINDVLTSRYLEQDMSAIEALADESFKLMKDQKLRAKLEKTLIKNRNYRMLRKSLPKVVQGKAFIAVGALHLPGKEGLLALLEKEGYFIHVIAE